MWITQKFHPHPYIQAQPVDISGSRPLVNISTAPTTISTKKINKEEGG